MCIKKNLFHSAGIALVGFIITIMTMATSSHVYAQESPPIVENGTCASCHEDLYFLHDTGNWFCIREAPMRCVDCHGGDPYTFEQEAAHANRQPHPIINEDVSKCQECHPAECDERVQKFDSVAGISDVMVSLPYQPKPTTVLEQPLDTQTGEAVEYPGWVSAREILVLALIAGLAFIIYFVRKTHHA
jgi:hypothetical protein